jgi:ribosome-binding protein aMBF1 (putative translation factor)
VYINEFVDTVNNFVDSFFERPYTARMGTKDAQLAEAFGAKLRELRLAAEMSQGDLGKRCSPAMQIQAIARYEAGVSGPTLAVVYRLAAALGVEPGELLPAIDGKARTKKK